MKIAFLSTRNAIRSIMAEAVARKMARVALLLPEIYSAGVEPADNVPETVLKLLRDKGYPTEGLKPKGIHDIPYENIDLLITLSTEARDHCPYSENHIRREHWFLDEVKVPKREEISGLLTQLESHMKALFKIS